MSRLFHKSSEPIRALIVGGRGSIGAGLIRTLQRVSQASIVEEQIPVESIVCTSRDQSFVDAVNSGDHVAANFDEFDPSASMKISSSYLDPCSEASFVDFSSELKRNSYRPNLIFNATGILHGSLNDHLNGSGSITFRPETSMKKISAGIMETNFRINTLTNGLALRYLLSEVADRNASSAVFASLSAKVGSISDNQAGGWYSYRASKAATNALIKCAAIECKRTHPGWRVLALHPGTVVSELSDPFMRSKPGAKNAKQPISNVEEYERALNEAPTGTTPYMYWTADMSAGRLFEVMNTCTVEEHSGKLVDYAGRVILP